MSVKFTFGAEPKKVAILLGIVALGGFLYWRGFFNEETPANAGGTATQPLRVAIKQAFQPSDAEPDSASAPKAAAQVPGQAASRDFRPSLKHKTGESIDPEHFDPTLRRDLIDRLAAVRVERVERSLFDFSSEPAPIRVASQPEPKIVVKKPGFRKQGPEPIPEPAPPPPPPPPP